MQTLLGKRFILVLLSKVHSPTSVSSWTMSSKSQTSTFIESPINDTPPPGVHPLRPEQLDGTSTSKVHFLLVHVFSRDLSYDLLDL